jgi:CelD/BcsL family acetyltransferase involved in cellulose biosynthesis
VALALFNRAATRRDGTSLHLQESIDPLLASIFVEHNGPLVAIADPVLRQAVLVDLLTHAMRAPIEPLTTNPRRLVLSGVGPDCADAATMTGGLVDEKSRRMAPFSDLRALDPDRPFIDSLSRNTRHQLRRSNRLYAAQGELAIRRAQTVDEGMAYFVKMIDLHNITWKARGKKGAFATSAVRRFYQRLIESGIPSGEVDLLRVTAGEAVVGYLMNFSHDGVVSAYQSGFDYAAATPQQKPGLTSHYLAIEAYRSQDIAVYDFLAGADRYKLSLANSHRWLHWLSAAPAWHPYSVGTRIRRLLKI